MNGYLYLKSKITNRGVDYVQDTDSLLFLTGALG